MWDSLLPQLLIGVIALLAGATAGYDAMRVLGRRSETGPACGRCGYSRQGLADESPCPECGAVAPSPRLAPLRVAAKRRGRLLRLSLWTIAVALLALGVEAAVIKSLMPTWRGQTTTFDFTTEPRLGVGTRHAKIRATFEEKWIDMPWQQTTQGRLAARRMTLAAAIADQWRTLLEADMLTGSFTALDNYERMSQRDTPLDAGDLAAVMQRHAPDFTKQRLQNIAAALARTGGAASDLRSQVMLHSMVYPVSVDTRTFDLSPPIRAQWILPPLWLIVWLSGAWRCVIGDR